MTEWIGSVSVRDRLFHQVDLGRRGVRAQDHRLGLAEVDVEGVPQSPGRVRGRDVERLEVVPVALDLGTFGDGEAHARRRRLRVRAG